MAPVADRPAILVTGAASGIGLATTACLIAEGHPVVGVDVDAEALADAARRLGPHFSPLRHDLIDAAATAALVAELAGGNGLRAIVHSAALFPQADLAETDVALWDRVMAVNVRAAFVLARAGALAMRVGGSLVLLTSGAGGLAAAADAFQRRFLAYGASKAALDRLAAGIAVEMAAAGIVVTTVSPGAFVETGGTSRVDLAAAPRIARVAVDHVGRAVAWLAAAPRTELAGARLAATGFGREWGEGISNISPRERA